MNEEKPIRSCGLPRFGIKNVQIHFVVDETDAKFLTASPLRTGGDQWDALILHCVLIKKHVTTFYKITLTISVRLQ